MVTAHGALLTGRSGPLLAKVHTTMAEPASSLFSPRDLDTGHWFAVEPPELLYHYTTVSSAYGILTSDAIWMTKIRYLNDTSEVEIGIITFREVLEELIRRPGPSDEIELLEAVKDGLGSFATSNICVVSFCEHGDLLSQWRWYGEGGRGLSIGVESTVLRRLGHATMNLWKCIYDERAHRELLHAMVDRLLLAYRAEREQGGGSLGAEKRHYLLGRFFTSFLQVVPIIKNGNFAEEREWRLVSVPVDVDDDAYGVSMTGDRIIQRYELRFPRDPDGRCRAIGRIVVGPTKDPELIGEAMVVLCRKNSIECRTIAYSGIPFRHQ
jgi:hypothetical protein